MKRTLLLPLALGMALSASVAQARTVVVTDANNEKTVSLHKGDTLIVRLPFNTTTGYSWHVVYDPGGPLPLSGGHIDTFLDNRVGAPGIQEFRFAVDAASFQQGGWLRLISLRPFSPGLKDGKLWEIKYTIAAAK